jgi:DNA adenine methylase
MLAPYIAGVIEENFLTGCTFYEPFAGGAAVSLELLRLGYIDRAVWIERDPLVFAFWHSVKHEASVLCEQIEALEVSLDTWRSFLPLRAVDNPYNCDFSVSQLGIAGLFFNRANFSGVIGAGPIGGMKQESKYKIDCRFNKKNIISAIKNISEIGGAIDVRFGDALAFLKKNFRTLKKNSFAYVDPPYFGQGQRLYRHHFNRAQHQDLADILKTAEYPWLLSYDDAPEIRDLYGTSHLQPIYLDHSVKSSRIAKEIVLSNLVIPPPVYVGVSHTQEVATA